MGDLKAAKMGIAHGGALRGDRNDARFNEEGRDRVTPSRTYEEGGWGPSPTPSNAHLTRMGYMGWNVSAQHGWTNLHLSRDMAAAAAAHRAHGWRVLYDDLPATVVARGQPAPPAGYEAALTALANEHVSEIDMSRAHLLFN